MKLFLNIPINTLMESATASPQIIDEIDALSDSIRANMTKDVHVPKEVLNSFKLKENLNTDIWINNTLNPKVRVKLIQIAQDFFKDLDIPQGIQIKDIIFTGSLANFNWSKYSDIDLHIVLDFKGFEAEPKFVEDYFYAQKSIWNQEHDISVFNFPVELYVQDINAKLVATAVYSVLNNKWVKMPKRESFQLDKTAIKDKADKIIYNLRDIRQDYQDHQYKAVVDKVKKLKDKIKQMRNAGLERGGEFSLENLVFKVLRRTPFMDVLDSFKSKSYDKLMSVSEKTDTYVEPLDEGQVLDNSKFKYKRESEDELAITASYESEIIGKLSMVFMMSAYWYFENELSEEQYDEMFPDDRFVLIGWLEVPQKIYRGEGIAKQLMKRAIAKAKQQGYTRVYLNASPIGTNGFQLNDLVGFYKSFGFEEIIHQGGNVQMILKLDSQVDEAAMDPKMALHKKKKDLETKIGRRLPDSEWEAFLASGHIPKKKNPINIDPERHAEIQARQTALQAKYANLRGNRLTEGNLYTKGGVLLIIGTPMANGQPSLYVTQVNSLMQLNRKKVDNSDGKPAMMAILGNQVFRVAMVDGILKAQGVAWSSEGSMLKILGLTRRDVVLNNQKTPIHWETLQTDVIHKALLNNSQQIQSIPRIKL